MDTVVTGLIGGVASSLLIVIGGVVVYFSPSLQEKFSSHTTMVTWLFLLSAITVGQLVLTSILVSAFSEAPSQTEQGVAQ